MARLLRDRFFAYDAVRGCDLTTGEDVRLDDLPEDGGPGDDADLAPLLEVLDHGRDGNPCWVVAEARGAAQAAALARRAAAHGRHRGFVPLIVDLYARVCDALDDEVRDRALLLIARPATDVAAARRALVGAAARSPRPHVLLTIRVAPSGRTRPMPAPALSVREARAAYGVEPLVAPRGPRVPAEVLRHVQRAARAAEFQRSGRHAAAERLLRDVAGTLARRDAPGPAAATLVRLARLLLERGRAAAADSACDAAAGLAHLARDERLAVEARLWQAAARTDAGRLTEAESLCRAVVSAGLPSPGHQAWAHAALARVLVWQGRVEEAAGLELADAMDATDVDEATLVWTGAIAVKVRLAAADLFGAGRRARTLLSHAEPSGDPLVGAIAQTAHLRVLTAMGDFALAEQCLLRIVELTRAARVPLRAVRARLIWHDALRRGGCARDAERAINPLARMGRVLPPLLRRAVEQRVIRAGPDGGAAAPGGTGAPRTSPVAIRLVQLAHEEEDEAKALRRIFDDVASELRTSRVDLLSCDAGPVSVLMTAGAGLPTRIGSRVLESGIAVSAPAPNGGRELGVPVRLGARLLAALVCRWPLDRDPVPHAPEVLALAAAVAAPRVDALLADARETARAAAGIPELVGASAVMGDLRRAVERAAAAPFAVLVEGESGVGKELVARAIHQLGPRRERRFCDLNCAALPEELLESELFGHARGAFTGAVAERAGLFEEANGGTLFLDELPDLSPRGQAKLLRVLQQHEVRRLGEAFSRTIDVRLVTATNRDMRREVADGRFRQDLLYRLDVIRIHIPPLRERPEDVPALADHFWRAARGRVGSAATLTHGVLAALARYHWPGNVRELQNVLAALAVAAPARGLVRAALLPAAITGATSVTCRRLADARAQFERRCVEVALARAGGNRTRAAAALGLSRQGLLKTMERLGIGLGSADGTDAPGRDHPADRG